MSENPVLVPCPHCAAMNRMLTARLVDAPQCGRCHEALFVGKPVELTSEDFDRHVGRGELPIVVDFWAPWCGPCLQMAPQFAAAAKALEPAFRLAKLDTEAQPAPAARFGIRSIPTMILFHRGRELARVSGAMSAEQIVQWVRSQHIAG
jgi:thioredoxin 2